MGALCGGMLGAALLSYWFWCTLSSTVPSASPDRDWARPCQGIVGVKCFGTLHPFSAKSQIYCENPSLWQDQPVMRNKSRESTYATLSLDGTSRGQVCVLTILQLSANLAAARMAPVLSPTSASAKKAGTGDTATKVSEKQTWRVPVGALTHPMRHRNDCSKSLSSLINDAMLHFFLIINPNNKMKIFNTS